MILIHHADLMQIGISILLIKYVVVLTTINSFFFELKYNYMRRLFNSLKKKTVSSNKQNHFINNIITAKVTLLFKSKRLNRFLMKFGMEIP